MARIKVDADFRQVVAEQRRVAKGAETLESQYKQVRTESNRLERAAVKAWKESQGPLRQYNTDIGNLKKLLKDGRISQEQFTAASAKFKRNLDEAGKSADRAFGGKMAANLLNAANAASIAEMGIRAVTSAGRRAGPDR